MTLNSLFNKYTLSEVQCCTSQTELLLNNLEYQDKTVKSRSFGVEDLRIEDSL